MFADGRTSKRENSPLLEGKAGDAGLRILLVAHQFFPEHSAGVEVLTLGLAKAAKGRGHEPFVLAAKRTAPVTEMLPGEVEDYHYAGVPVRRVGRPTEGPGRPYRLDYENHQMAQRIREYVQHIDPDVVHAMHFQGVSTSIIPVVKEFSLPLVYTATDFWTICPVVDLRRHDGVVCEGPNIAHCPRCIASRHPGTRMQAVANRTPGVAWRAAGTLSATRLSRASRQLRQLGAVRERAGFIGERLGAVDRILAPTRLTRDLLLKNGVGGAKVKVSRYGVDLSGIEGVEPSRNDPPPLRIGFMGTLAPHKGCDLLIKAFRSLPPEAEVTLTIHGNLERFKRYVRRLRNMAEGDERISFAGAFGREGVGEVLAGMDALAVPSRWYENAPVVIYEAFAARTPVVATDLGGMSEVVEHGKNGLLFALDDAGDLAKQLRRLYEEPGLLGRLRENPGPVKTVEENMAELEDLYRELLRNKGELQ